MVGATCLSPGASGAQLPPNKSLICPSSRSIGQHTIMHFGPWGLVSSWGAQGAGPCTLHFGAMTKK